MSKFFKATAINCGQPFTGDADKLPGRHVDQHSARFRQSIESLHPTVDLDPAAEFTQIILQRFGDGLGAAAWNRPTHGVSGNSEYKSKRG